MADHTSAMDEVDVQNCSPVKLGRVPQLGDSKEYSCVIHKRSADSELTDAPLRPFGTINVTGSRIFGPAVKALSASPPRISGCSSRRFFTVIAQAYRGATCRNVLAINQDSCAIFRAGRRSGAWKKIFEMLAADADNEYAM